MKYFFPLVMVVFLGGCAELSPYLIDQVSDQTAWDVRRASLDQINHWSIRGRVAVQAGEEGWSAALHWDQDNEDYIMRFIAPLGQGTYQLEGNKAQVSLLTAENKMYTADDPESLLLNNLGWSVPLYGLRYWVKGIPAPGIEHKNLIIDEQGRMTDLQQSGWRISISRYTTEENTQLPSKLFMTNDRFKLRIVVEGWKTKT